ncbi:MAG: hypothetical protein GY947_24265 [Rhodobacteraceae bacterium]|nr:hypothetical protein [Paracoccaceae bacterium]
MGVLNEIRAACGGEAMVPNRLVRLPALRILKFLVSRLAGLLFAFGVAFLSQTFDAKAQLNISLELVGECLPHLDCMYLATVINRGGQPVQAHGAEIVFRSDIEIRNVQSLQDSDVGLEEYFDTIDCPVSASGAYSSLTCNIQASGGAFRPHRRHRYLVGFSIPTGGGLPTEPVEFCAHLDGIDPPIPPSSCTTIAVFGIVSRVRDDRYDLGIQAYHVRTHCPSDERGRGTFLCTRIRVSNNGPQTFSKVLSVRSIVQSDHGAGNLLPRRHPLLGGSSPECRQRTDAVICTARNVFLPPGSSRDFRIEMEYPRGTALRQPEHNVQIHWKKMGAKSDLNSGNDQLLNLYSPGRDLEVRLHGTNQGCLADGPCRIRVELSNAPQQRMVLRLDAVVPSAPAKLRLHSFEPGQNSSSWRCESVTVRNRANDHVLCWGHGSGTVNVDFWIPIRFRGQFALFSAALRPSQMQDDFVPDIVTNDADLTRRQIAQQIPSSGFSREPILTVQQRMPQACYYGRECRLEMIVRNVGFSTWRGPLTLVHSLRYRPLVFPHDSTPWHRFTVDPASAECELVDHDVRCHSDNVQLLPGQLFIIALNYSIHPGQVAAWLASTAELQSEEMPPQSSARSTGGVRIGRYGLFRRPELDLEVTSEQTEESCARDNECPFRTRIRNNGPDEFFGVIYYYEERTTHSPMPEGTVLDNICDHIVSGSGRSTRFCVLGRTSIPALAGLYMRSRSRYGPCVNIRYPIGENGLPDSGTYNQRFLYEGRTRVIIRRMLWMMGYFAAVNNQVLLLGHNDQLKFWESVRKYQSDHELSPTGKVDDALLYSLFDRSAEIPRNARLDNNSRCPSVVRP